MAMGLAGRGRAWRGFAASADGAEKIVRKEAGESPAVDVVRVIGGWSRWF